MNKKQKYYCYTITEAKLKSDSEIPEYVRENVQIMETYPTVQEAFDAFLKAESYDANMDTNIQFQTIPSDGQEVISVGFSKLLKTDGTRPSPKEIVMWNNEEFELVEHTYSIIIYEFECRPIDLKTLKKSVKIK